MTPFPPIFSGSPANNANLAKSPQVINAMNLGGVMRKNLIPWREVARELRILKDNGEPDTGLAYKIVIEGYEPKTMQTRTRFWWPPICPECHQRIAKSRPGIAYTRLRREGLNEIAQRMGYASWSEFETYKLKSNDTEAFGKRKGKA